MEYKEIDGNLITLALQGEFDVIAHGCNCFCTMGAGLAPQMAKAFGCDYFPKERQNHSGDINKLGNIDYMVRYLIDDKAVDYLDVRKKYDNIVQAATKIKDIKKLIVVNCYSQYGFGKNHKEGSVAPLDYAALELCFKKMNHIFKGKHIGLPGFIGCGLAGGSIDKVRQMIKDLFTDCIVTVVIYK